MKHYAGLDISMKETAICIVQEDGKIIHESSVATNPEQITQCLLDPKVTIERVGLETGSLSRYLGRELRKKGLPVLCVDARHMAGMLSLQINKTDRNDAKGIAQIMRTGLYKTVHQKSQWSVDVGVVLGTRRTLLRQRVQLANTIRGQLKAYGIRKLRGGHCGFINAVQSAIEGLPATAQLALECLLESYEHQCEQVEILTDELKEIARAKPEIALLTSVPGIGLITGLTYLVEIDDPTRFSDPRAVGALVGMTPTQYSSGESQRQGRISKRGNRELRTLLYEAGVVVLTRTRSWSKLKAWGTRIRKRSGLKKAAVAVGRKLAVIMLQMLLTGQPFHYGKPKTA